MGGNFTDRELKEEFGKVQGKVSKQNQAVINFRADKKKENIISLD